LEPEPAEKILKERSSGARACGYGLGCGLVNVWALFEQSFPKEKKNRNLPEVLVKQNAQVKEDSGIDDDRFVLKNRRGRIFIAHQA